MNNNFLIQQDKLLRLKRFLNRISDISFSYNDIKQRIYRENLNTETQIFMLQTLVDEAKSFMETAVEEIK